MILIGSEAIQHWFSDFKRKPKDKDFLVFEGVNKENAIIEGEKHEYYNCKPLTDLYLNSSESILLPKHLYTLKVSHIFWDIFWDKHIYDIVFLREKGCELDKELFYKLYEFWSTYHGVNKRVDFDKDNEEFFKDKVTRQFNHDDLHKIINPSPLFETLKKNANKAEIDEELFTALPLHLKLELVREEAYVISLERFLIPEKLKDLNIAYRRVLKILITRLSPLWLAVFIVEHYKLLLKPNINYYQKFKDYELSGNC